MRHKISGRKLNRTSSHRKSMLANMAVALITHEQVKTTLPKAKELRRFIEPLITISKKNTLFSRRRLVSLIKDRLAVEKLLTVLGDRYKNRNGGYTRIIKSGFRYGDVAPVAYIEFVDRNEEQKGSVLTREAIIEQASSSGKKQSRQKPVKSTPKLDADNNSKEESQPKSKSQVIEKKAKAPDRNTDIKTAKKIVTTDDKSSAD